MVSLAPGSVLPGWSSTFSDVEVEEVVDASFSALDPNFDALGFVESLRGQAVAK